ncbi:MAG: preprotein translocase subunit SecY [Nanoarchaeota archaeon]|nr:preprotein translocase subunit SecY [Nanoarchaeota archaeon]
MTLKDILHNLPEVQPPAEKKLSFGVKAKWTLIILATFFVLAAIPLYAMSGAALQRFEQLEAILGASFGSIITLGIGPIVMASIILQLLVGSKIINIDTSTPDGKKFFQGIQKLMVLFFIFFEATIYVVMGGIASDPSIKGSTVIVIAQLCVGGLAIMFMDEISSKWGFGSGVSLFIAAGVSKTIFTALFQFIDAQGVIAPVGRIFAFVASLMGGDTIGAMLAGVAVLITAVIFLCVVWLQGLKVEIPLSSDRMRGYGIKWPLAFFYTSVIPVILVSALAANVQLFGSLIQNALGHATILGGFTEQGVAISGFSFWIAPVNIVTPLITGGFQTIMIGQVLAHVLFYVSLSTLFAYFWMKTSGMDAQSQAQKIMESGLTIPGFRKDERILESVLQRYILPLTIMGGATIGLIASLSNISGAVVAGTSILLVVMIMYQFYQNIAQQHAVDMHPALKNFIK